MQIAPHRRTTAHRRSHGLADLNSDLGADENGEAVTRNATSNG
jgi:hypothetical protein